jgi:hypothetical protein
MVLHEVKPGWTITKEWDGYTIQADIAFAEIVPEEYLGIFFSGGRAPEYIRDNPDLIRVTQWFFAHHKPIASVCHGVEIPARAGCVKGRRMATVGKCRFDLEVCGGIYVNEPCVVDGISSAAAPFTTTDITWGPGWRCWRRSAMPPRLEVPSPRRAILLLLAGAGVLATSGRATELAWPRPAGARELVTDAARFQPFAARVAADVERALGAVPAPAGETLARLLSLRVHLGLYLGHDACALVAATQIREASAPPASGRFPAC